MNDHFKTPPKILNIMIKDFFYFTLNDSKYKKLG